MVGTANHWFTRGLALVTVGLLGAGLAACGSSPSSTPSSSNSPSAHTSTSTSGTVGTATSSYGTILASSSGLSLYMLTADSSTASVCTGGCTAIWHPVTTTGTPRAGQGVSSGRIGTIARSGGVHQVTYNGHPLYTFSGDTAAGQVNGEGIHSFGGTWYVLNSSGTPVTHSSSSSTSTSASGGGYNY